MKSPRHVLAGSVSALFVLVLLLLSAISSSAWAQGVGDYRSVATGNWNSIATWERFDGTTWVAAAATPTSADGAITIRNGNTVTISAAGLTYDQVTVDAGGQVTVAATITSTLANGAGTDLVINGTWLNSGGTWTTTGAAWSVGPGGTFIHNTTSGISTPLNTATLDPASTFIYRGSSTLVPAASFSARTYGNLAFESSSGTWIIGATGAGVLQVNGDFTIGSGVTFSSTMTGALTAAGNFTNNGTLTNGAGTQVYTFTGANKSVSGSGAITFETLNVNSGASLTLAVPVTLASTFIGTVASGGSLASAAAFTNSGTLNVNGTFQLNPGGSVTGTAFTYGAAGTLVFNNSSPVSVSSSSLFWPATNGPPNVTLTGAGGVTISNDFTVPLTLNLGSSKVSTGANTLIANGSVLRTSGYVLGNLRRPVTASGTYGFDIGEAAGYTPVSVNFASVGSTNGTLTASTAASGVPAASSGLSAANYVNRAWTLTNSGIVTPAYSATFTFLPADLQGSANPANLIVAKNTSGTWSKPAVGTRTSTSTQATGLGAFSQFLLGEIATHTITATAGAGGTISPSGAVSVNDGADQAFAITPDAGHHVVDVKVDNVSQGAIGSYPFTGVTADHTIDATFAIDTYTITASAGAGGTISPSGAVSVNGGADQAFTITPDIGFGIQDVLVDGSSVGAVASHTFTAVTASHTISASFSSLSALVSAGSPVGVLSPGTPSLVIPVNLTRPYSTANRLYHVNFQLGGGLTLTGGTAGVTEGTFLTANGASTHFQVVDNGGGSYTVDCSILGLPCNATGLSGNLFNVAVSSSAPAGPGTLTLTEVALRDCDNGVLASSIGAAASVAIDNTAPVVTVTAPNGGETWTVATVHDIAWSATDGSGFGSGPVSLEWSADDGATWSPVASALAASGTYAWTVPATPTATARVRASATDAHGNVGTDASDAAFAIATTTSVAVASDHNPSTFGQAVTFTATLTPSTAGGTVQFRVDGSTFGAPVVVNGGVAASAALASLPVGTHTVMAEYGGDATHVASAGSLAGGQVVGLASSAVTVTSDHDPSMFGQAVTFTATVTPAGAGGTVQFKVDGSAVGAPVAVSGGVATSTAIASLSVGTHTVDADYSGDGSYAASAGSLSGGQIVNTATTSVAVASNHNPSTFGQAVTFTATMSPAPAGGTVQFKVDGSSLGTPVVVSGGAATSDALASLPVGTHTVEADYSGDGTYGANAGSLSGGQVVDLAASSVTVASDHNPSAFGQAVTFAATVTPSGAGGTVQFKVDGSAVGAPVAVIGGVATGAANSSLSVGTHTVEADYSGDAGHSASSGTLAGGQAVSAAASSVALASDHNPSAYAQAVTFTATVTPSTASGTVQFKVDGSDVGAPVTVSAGVAASDPIASLAPGTHTVAADYSGDGTYAASSGALAGGQVVEHATSAVAVASDHNPSTFGQAVTFTATLTPSAATGTVQFKVDGSAVGSPVAVSGGAAASAPISTLTGGTHTVEADYSGDATYAASSGALSGGQLVNPASSSVAVASDHNPSAFGQAVTFTATLTPSSAGGTVQFKVDGSALGAPVALSGGVASSSAIASLSVGTHTVEADYSGDGTYSASAGSLAGGQVVGLGGSATALAVDVNPSVSGDAIVLTATVTPAPPAPGVPGGTVTFYDGASPIGTGTLSGAGVATLGFSSLAVGSHSLSAQYGGDATFGASTSSVLTQVVRAKIVATAGANGAVSPPGTTTYLAGATPNFVFTPNSGYHVGDVLLDGASVGAPANYTFAALGANHTLDVSFAANPPVAAISALAVARVLAGNDADGTAKVAVSWPALDPGKTVEVWRAPYGNYPEYDDAPGAGSVPTIPSYPPASPWQVTPVTTSGGTDEVTVRDAWYYVAFVRDGYGTRSPVSNLAGAVLNYHLGDVSNGVTPGLGDNRVDIADVSLLGIHYGITGAAVTPFDYLDVGPTTDHSVNGRPLTDNRVDFEDLIVFAINFQQVSAPQNGSRPALVAAAADELRLELPGAFTDGRIVARLQLSGTGAIQGLSAKLSWNAAAVAPESFAPGALLDAQDAVAMSGQPGVIDIARLGVGSAGLIGQGEAATVTFRRVGEGDAGIAIESVDARSAPNLPVAMTFTNSRVPLLPAVTSFDRPAPNPVRGRTTLSFALSRGGAVELAVFGVDGRLVRTLERGTRDAGAYQVAWDGRDDAGRPLGAGVYFARLVTPQGRWTRSIVLLK